jgi:formate dehydrogenase iron-sulfur subunit
MRRHWRWVPTSLLPALAGAGGTLRGLAIELVRNGSRGMFWLEPLLEVQTPRGRMWPMARWRPRTCRACWMPACCTAAPMRLCHGVTEQIPYLAQQERLTFARMGVTDPLSLADYAAHDGWLGLQRRADAAGRRPAGAE